jgi:hypothetical protein
MAGQLSDSTDTALQRSLPSFVSNSFTRPVGDLARNGQAFLKPLLGQVHNARRNSSGWTALAMLTSTATAMRQPSCSGR